MRVGFDTDFGPLRRGAQGVPIPGLMTIKERSALGSPTRTIACVSIHAAAAGALYLCITTIAIRSIASVWSGL